MLKRLDWLLWLLAIIVVSRLFSMAIVPLLDTTEARYAEVARIMAESGDWITPWFNYGTPFWGKPPLSFWTEALSFKLFGVTEFAARLPSWLANLGMLALIYHLTKKLADQRQALFATLIFATMALSYIMSGAVLTDPFLALGTTLTLVSIILALREPGSHWRWWIFVGLAIGLLAKGPLALVLSGGPLLLWVIWRRQYRDLLQLPWDRGVLLTALLSLPWYIAAELKSPGFINYFIIGEHFLRFVDPGWSGDLYGSAHNEPYGTIWLYWLWASLPWGPIVVIIAVYRWARTKNSRPAGKKWLTDEQRLLLLSALFPSLFFTFAGNILWTYQLPALIPLAILAAMLMAKPVPASRFNQFGIALATMLMPLALILIGCYAYLYPEKLNTEKMLVAHYNEFKGNSSQPLIYIGKAPFSARFYSKGGVKTAPFSEVERLINNSTEAAHFIAINNEEREQIISSLSTQVKVELANRRFTLLKTDRLTN